MAAPTYYDILGVGHAATAETIRRAYRAKAKSLHPDVSKEPDAQARFAQLSQAYETLSDRGRRREYDRSLSQPENRPGSTAAHYTWTNIATERSSQARDISELDELYETFFMPHSADSPKPRPSPAQTRKRR